MARRVIIAKPGARKPGDAVPGTGRDDRAARRVATNRLATFQAAEIAPLVRPGAEGPGLWSHDPSGRPCQTDSAPDNSHDPAGSSTARTTPMARRVIIAKPGARKPGDAVPGTGRDDRAARRVATNRLATFQAAEIAPLVRPGAEGPGLWSHDPSGRPCQTDSAPDNSHDPAGSSTARTTPMARRVITAEPGAKERSDAAPGQETERHGGPQGRDKPSRDLARAAFADAARRSR